MLATVEIDQAWTDYHSNRIWSKEVIIMYYTVEALASKNRIKKHVDI